MGDLRIRAVTIALFLSTGMPAGGACGPELAVATTLAERGRPAGDYVRALDALAARLADEPEAVRAAVRHGLAGGWSDEARWTLQQNPRLHRVLAPAHGQ